MRNNLVLATISFVLLAIIALQLQCANRSRKGRGSDDLEPPQSAVL